MPKRDVNYFSELLYQLLNGVSEEDAVRVIRHFLKWMERQGAQGLFPKLMEAYQEAARRAEGIIKVEVRSAREIPELTKQIRHLLNDKEVIIEAKLDPEIIGGAVIQVDDLRIDASIKGRINELKKAMIYGLN